MRDERDPARRHPRDLEEREAHRRQHREEQAPDEARDRTDGRGWSRKQVRGHPVQRERGVEQNEHGLACELRRERHPEHDRERRRHHPCHPRDNGPASSSNPAVAHTESANP